MAYLLLDFYAATPLVQAVRPEEHIQDITHAKDPPPLSPHGDN